MEVEVDQSFKRWLFHQNDAIILEQMHKVLNLEILKHNDKIWQVHTEIYQKMSFTSLYLEISSQPMIYTN